MFFNLLINWYNFHFVFPQIPIRNNVKSSDSHHSGGINSTILNQDHDTHVYWSKKRMSFDVLKRGAYIFTSAGTSCLMCFNNTCYVPSNQAEYWWHNRGLNKLCKCSPDAMFTSWNHYLRITIIGLWNPTKGYGTFNATSLNWPLWARMNNKGRCVSLSLFPVSLSLSRHTSD